MDMSWFEKLEGSRGGPTPPLLQLQPPCCSPALSGSGSVSPDRRTPEERAIPPGILSTAMGEVPVMLLELVTRPVITLTALGRPVLIPPVLLPVGHVRDRGRSSSRVLRRRYSLMPVATRLNFSGSPVSLPTSCVAVRDIFMTNLNASRRRRGRAE